MKYLTSLLLMCFALLATPGLASADEPMTPPQIIDTVANRILDELNADRKHYEAEPSALGDVVRREMLQYLDTVYSARLILGRHSRKATPKQIHDMADALVDILIDRYAESLIQFKSKSQITVLPLRGKNTNRLTRVKTKVKLDSGQYAPVDFAFHKTKRGWQVFDVMAEGVSYVTTYRNQIVPEVSHDGLDAVIARLQSGEEHLNDDQ